MWLWMAVRECYFISGCIVVDYGPCMVLEQWLICSERGPSAVLEQCHVVAIRCPCVVFCQ
jgi:hypothetical protein